ncbi:MAG TPA: hypothetical protein VI837_04815, partial [Blastocatellia bacterium]|nr:hypothetical protein [Blastocatellia bacterium]
QAAESIGDEMDRARAFCKIAVAQARAGQSAAARSSFDAALQSVQSMSEEERRAEALREVAGRAVSGGFAEGALAAADRLRANRYEWLAEVADDFVKANDKERFKRFLIPCAYHYGAVYRMCALLARLYPEQATAVAAVVSPMGIEGRV